MRSMTIQETKKFNGGKTAYLQCKYCKKKFYYAKVRAKQIKLFL